MPRNTNRCAICRNICLTCAFVAPRAFNNPIVFTRSKIMMNRHEINVNPATHDIRINITTTFVSSKSSQLNTLLPIVEHC